MSAEFYRVNTQWQSPDVPQCQQVWPVTDQWVSKLHCLWKKHKSLFWIFQSLLSPSPAQRGQCVTFQGIVSPGHRDEAAASIPSNITSCPDKVHQALWGHTNSSDVYYLPHICHSAQWRQFGRKVKGSQDRPADSQSAEGLILRSLLVTPKYLNVTQLNSQLHIYVNYYELWVRLIDVKMSAWRLLNRG